jgi:hypothetical protein
MFEYSFVPTGKTRRPLTVVVAALGEAILITSLVLVPMFFVEELPTRGLLRALMLAPVPFAPPAPPPPMLAKAIPHAAAAPRKFNADALVSPVVVPKVVAIISEAPAMAFSAAESQWLRRLRHRRPRPWQFRLPRRRKLQWEGRCRLG